MRRDLYQVRIIDDSVETYLKTFGRYASEVRSGVDKPGLLPTIVEVSFTWQTLQEIFKIESWRNWIRLLF